MPVCAGEDGGACRCVCEGVGWGGHVQASEGGGGRERERGGGDRQTQRQRGGRKGGEGERGGRGQNCPTHFWGVAILKLLAVVFLQRFEDLVQRPFNFCIIDEVDSILIDEARTPLIISGPSGERPFLTSGIPVQCFK
jgi:hypothetical protein